MSRVCGTRKETWERDVGKGSFPPPLAASPLVLAFSRSLRSPEMWSFLAG